MTDGRLSNEELERALQTITRWGDEVDAWTNPSAQIRAHIATLQRSADEMREALTKINDGQVTVALVAYHGERYARDYEYIDNNLRSPMRVRPFCILWVDGRRRKRYGQAIKLQRGDQVWL